MSDPQIRNPLADYLKAVNDQIAERESVGAGATPYLLEQKAELEAKLFPKPVAAPEPAPEPVEVVVPLEHKAAEPAPEHAVPESPESARKPGRPRRDVEGS